MGIQQAPVAQFAGHRRNEDPRAAIRREIGQIREKSLFGAIDDRMVERIIDIENMRDDLGFARSVPVGLYLIGRTGDRYRIRSIDRRDTYIVETLGFRKGQRGILAKHNGCHLAFAGKEILMQRALGDDCNRFGSRQRLGGISGCDFADRMAEDRIGLDPHGPQAIRKRSLDCEQQRLRDLGIGQACGKIGSDQNIGQLLAEIVFKERAEGLKTLPEMAVFLISADTHSRPLRAVAGKDEGDLGGLRRSFARLADRIFACEMRIDGGKHGRAVLRAGSKAMAHGFAIGGSGSDDLTSLLGLGRFKTGPVVFK